MGKCMFCSCLSSSFISDQARIPCSLALSSNSYGLGGTCIGWLLNFEGRAGALPEEKLW